MLIHNNLKMNNKEYISIVYAVRDNAKKILNTPVHNHFTDHSISHSDRMLSVIDKLLAAPQILIDEEKLVLICAVLLHDIGMQATKEVSSEKFPLQNQELDYIREHHHEFSEEIIKNSISLDNSKKYYLGLENASMFVEDIAIVAKYHRKLDISSLSHDVVGDKTIRIKLLAALIRLADCLDIDYRRVNINKLKIQNIPVESKFFWFSHHYVRGSIIENRAIKIHFQFPKEYENDKTLISIISTYVLNEVHNHIRQVYHILDECGIRLRESVDVKYKYMDTSVYTLPEDLKEYINNEYIQQKSVEKEMDKSFEKHTDITNNATQPPPIFISDENDNIIQETFTQNKSQINSPVISIDKTKTTAMKQVTIEKDKFNKENIMKKSTKQEVQEQIPITLDKSDEKYPEISSVSGVSINYNNSFCTQPKDNEMLDQNITIEEQLHIYQKKIKLYEELGIINCTKGLKDTDLEPLKCMSHVHSSLFFMGVGGEKWVKDQQLRKSFENMLLQTKSVNGEVKFLLINPASNAYKNLYRLRGESVPYDSYGHFVNLIEEYDNLKVRLYSNMPSFRMQFVDNTYLAVSRYYFNKSSHEQWDGGWKIPHLIIHNEQQEFGNNEAKYRGSLFGSFLLAYNFTWQNGIDIKKWYDEGGKFNK